MNISQQDEAVLTDSFTDSADLRRAVEALLFVASEPLSVERLGKLIGGASIEIQAVLDDIAQDHADRGIVLREIAGGYRFAASPSSRAAVEAYLLPPKTSLSGPAMETLAIVAYMQPVTKADIEAVRGVNVDGVVATLTDRGLIAEAGRREVPGRPLLYVTTQAFLEAFGLPSLADLPQVEIEKQE